jgi:hypothetical protein
VRFAHWPVLGEGIRLADDTLSGDG